MYEHELKTIKNFKKQVSDVEKTMKISKIRKWELKSMKRKFSKCSINQ